MTKKNPLRRRAELRLAQTPDASAALTPAAARRLLHELRVHQIELDMQNEELRRIQAELEAARARYFDLYDLAPVGYCTLSENGLILEANLAAATLLGVERRALLKQPISRFILKADQDIYYLHHKRLLTPPPAGADGPGTPHQCELRMVKSNGPLLWVRLDATTAPAPWNRPGTTAANAPECRVVLSDITERKHAAELLTHYNAELEGRVAERTAVAEQRTRQLQALSRRLIRAEEAERQRITHVLHEEVQQSLVAARVFLHTGLRQVTDTVPQAALQAVDRTLQQALMETRHLAHEMVPPGLRAGGLLEAVKWLSRQLRKRYGFAAAVTAAGPLPPLTNELCICVYHAVRELLQNVFKHARVKSAGVSMRWQSDGWLKVTVRDAGAGFVPAEFQPPESESGSGLFGIRERVTGFGGRLMIASAVCRGTVVSLFLPAPERRKRQDASKGNTP